MNVQITLNSLSGYLSPNWQESTHRVIEESIKQNALKAWTERDLGSNSVRFLQKMAQNHFRFLNVSQKDMNTLIVSRAV